MEKITIEVSVAEYLLIHFNRKYGSQREAAKALGFSPSFLSAVLHGDKTPNKAILDDAGLTITKRVEVTRSPVRINPATLPPLGA